MDKELDILPYIDVSIISKMDHHTLIKKSSLIISQNNEYFLIEDEYDKILDVSKMPIYIKKDWFDYNRKELTLPAINYHIMEYEKMNLELHDPFYDPEKKILELKSIRRDFLIKKII